MLDTILHHAWHGPFQKPIRPLLTRALGDSQRIVAGPLFWKLFNGPEITCRLGIYELEVQQSLKRLLYTSDVVYDIGARNGYLSLLAARRVGKDGQVYSFAPLPDHASRITDLMTVNRVRNQETIRKAVSDRAESSLTKNCYTGLTTTTLSEFVANNRPPDLVILSVGGAEALVLRGATQLFTAPLPWLKPRIWLIETHNRDLDDEVRRTLENNGYRVERPGNSARPIYPRHIVATRRAINEKSTSI